MTAFERGSAFAKYVNFRRLLASSILNNFMKCLSMSLTIVFFVQVLAFSFHISNIEGRYVLETKVTSISLFGSHI